MVFRIYEFGISCKLQAKPIRDRIYNPRSDRSAALLLCIDFMECLLFDKHTIVELVFIIVPALRFVYTHHLRHTPASIILR